MESNQPPVDFPYKFPVYLSSVLRVIGDGRDHDKEEIRSHILAEFPLSPEQLRLRPSRSSVPVFVNKVAFAFNRLVFHKAILEVIPGKYRITDHELDVLKRCPKDARERDL